MSTGSISDEKVHQWLACVSDTPYISLHFESPALNGADRGEISGGGYRRCLMTFSEPANRAIWSMKDAKFTGLLRGRLTHFGVWDKLHGGALDAYGLLPQEETVLNGHGYIITAGKLAISLR